MARYTTLRDNVCQRLATGRWVSPDTSVFFTNKTDYNDITEILLKVALNIIKQTYRIVFIYDVDVDKGSFAALHLLNCAEILAMQIWETFWYRSNSSIT
jgi:hypothetical protein